VSKAATWLNGSRNGQAFYTALNEATPFLERPNSSALMAFDVNLSSAKVFNATGKIGSTINKFSIGSYKVGGLFLRGLSEGLGYDGVLVNSVKSGGGPNLNIFNQAEVNSIFTNPRNVDFSKLGLGDLKYINP